MISNYSKCLSLLSLFIISRCVLVGSLLVAWFVPRGCTIYSTLRCGLRLCLFRAFC